MVCLLAESTRYLTHSLFGYLHYIACIASPKENTKLAQESASETHHPKHFTPSNRTCINCWNLSKVSPASVAGSICDTFQDFNRFKFQRSWKIHLLDSQPEVEMNYRHSKKWSNGHLQVRPKEYHIHGLWPIGRWSISLQFFCPKKISKDRVLSRIPHLWGRLDSCQQSVWHLQVETPGVGHTPVAEPWWNTSLHLKRPRENYDNYAPLKTRSFKFCCPSGLSLPMRIHLGPTIV